MADANNQININRGILEKNMRITIDYKELMECFETLSTLFNISEGDSREAKDDIYVKLDATSLSFIAGTTVAAVKYDTTSAQIQGVTKEAVFRLPLSIPKTMIARYRHYRRSVPTTVVLSQHLVVKGNSGILEREQISFRVNMEARDKEAEEAVTFEDTSNLNYTIYPVNKATNLNIIENFNREVNYNSLLSDNLKYYFDYLVQTVNKETELLFSPGVVCVPSIYSTTFCYNRLPEELTDFTLKTTITPALRKICTLVDMMEVGRLYPKQDGGIGSASQYNWVCFKANNIYFQCALSTIIDKEQTFTNVIESKSTSTKPYTNEGVNLYNVDSVLNFANSFKRDHGFIFDKLDLSDKSHTITLAEADNDNVDKYIYMTVRLDLDKVRFERGTCAEMVSLINKKGFEPDVKQIMFKLNRQALDLISVRSAESVNERIFFYIIPMGDDGFVESKESGCIILTLDSTGIWVNVTSGTYVLIKQKGE